MLGVVRWQRQARTVAGPRNTVDTPARRPASQLSFQLVVSNLSPPQIMNCSLSNKFIATNESDGENFLFQNRGAATSTTEGTNLIGYKNENDSHTDMRFYAPNY